MGPSLPLLLFLFLALFGETRGRRPECTMSNPCGHQGLLLQFPFRLKGQPRGCGLPEFELSCSPDKQAMLELPISVKLLVKNITYESPEIIVWHPDDNNFERHRQLPNLNLSTSPFRFKFQYSDTVLSCSSNKSSDGGFVSIPWLSSTAVKPILVVAKPFLPVQMLDLSSCRRLYKASLPYVDGECVLNGKAFSLTWSHPNIFTQKKSIGSHSNRIKPT